MNGTTYLNPEVLDAIDVDESSLLPAPENLPESAIPYISATCKVGDALVSLLRAEAIVQSSIASEKGES